MRCSVGKVSTPLVLLLCIVSAAWGSSLDSSFSPVLRLFGSSGTGYPTAYISTVQPDGKILVGGRFTVANGVARSGVVRFNPDYTLDPTFNAGDFSVAELLLSPSTGGTIRAIRLQPDGKIVIGGSFRRGNETTVRSLERLNPDGSTDATFNPPNISPLIGDVVIQPDGRIIVGGAFETTATNPVTGQSATFKNLARLNPDGSFDFSFTGNAYQYSSNIVLQPDGKIVVANTQYSGPPFAGTAVVRYQANGTFDTVLAETDSGIEALEEQPDGKFLIGGSFAYVGSVFRARVARLNANGGLDPSFEIVNSLVGTVYDLALDAGGNVLVVGDFYFYDGVVTQYNVVRLTTAGRRDTSFNIDRRISGNVYEVNFLPNGNLLLGGAFPLRVDIVNFNTFYENLAVASPTGTIDDSLALNFSVTVQGVVYESAPQADGSVLFGGNFQYAENLVRRYVARYAPSGTLDPSLDPERNISIVASMAVQADGKILVANGGASVLLQRLTATGALDSTFTPPFVSFSASIQQRTVIQKILLQPDGKILVGGKLITGSATSPTLSGLVRLNPDGTRDTSFQVVAARGGTYFVNDLALQPDGKVILGGDFTNINNDSSYYYLARVNADGTVDPSFARTAPGAVGELELQADGKIVFGGNFGALRRVNPNGTSDDLNVPVNDAISALALQPDNRILVGGRFTSINGVARDRFARLFPDGTLDPSCILSANSTVHSISVQSDGRIILGGLFTRINGISRLGAARTGGMVSPTSVVSRKTHGNAGTFDIPLPFAGNPGIENRTGGNHTIIATFSDNLSAGDASVTSGTGNVSTATLNGNTLTVNLSGVANGQTLTVMLNNVTDTFGQTIPPMEVRMNLLFGDVNGNGIVNASDISQVKANAGATVSAANFRSDVTANGSINTSDVAAVKAAVGGGAVSVAAPAIKL